MPGKRRARTGKKARKGITEGRVHIQSTFNNTIVTITDLQGNVLAWGSSGTARFKGSRKGTPYAAQLAAQGAARQAMNNNGLRQVEVYVKGPLLKLIARATEDDDPGLADVLSKLLMIRVNTFSIDRDLAGKLKPKINKIEDRLKDQKWERPVRVKDREDLVYIFIKVDNKDRIVGVVVMAIEDDDEAVFVNIVGETDWRSIRKIGRKFDIDELEDLDENELPQKGRR